MLQQDCQQQIRFVRWRQIRQHTNQHIPSKDHSCSSALERYPKFCLLAVRILSISRLDLQRFQLILYILRAILLCLHKVSQFQLQ